MLATYTTNRYVAKAHKDLQFYGLIAPDKPVEGPRSAYKWLCWSIMLAVVVAFAGADVYANYLEQKGKGQALEPVTATGWVRNGIRTTWYALPLVVLTLVWLVWHFIVGAYAPGLPL